MAKDNGSPPPADDGKVLCELFYPESGRPAAGPKDRRRMTPKGMDELNGIYQGEGRSARWRPVTVGEPTAPAKSNGGGPKRPAKAAAPAPAPPPREEGREFPKTEAVLSAVSLAPSVEKLDAYLKDWNLFGVAGTGVDTHGRYTEAEAKQIQEAVAERVAELEKPKRPAPAEGELYVTRSTDDEEEHLYAPRRWPQVDVARFVRSREYQSYEVTDPEAILDAALEEHLRTAEAIPKWERLSASGVDPRTEKQFRKGQRGDRDRREVAEQLEEMRQTQAGRSAYVASVMGDLVGAEFERRANGGTSPADDVARAVEESQRYERENKEKFTSGVPEERAEFERESNRLRAAVVVAQYAAAVKVAGARLEWGDGGGKTGDIRASDSVQQIAEKSAVRRPFTHDGRLYVSTGNGAYPAPGFKGPEMVEAYELVPPAEFEGEASSYPARAQVDAPRPPEGFYHGMLVKQGKKEFVLKGPAVLFAAEGWQPEAAAEEEDAPAEAPTEPPASYFKLEKYGDTRFDVCLWRGRRDLGLYVVELPSGEEKKVHEVYLLGESTALHFNDARRRWEESGRPGVTHYWRVTEEGHAEFGKVGYARSVAREIAILDFKDGHYGTFSLKQLTPSTREEYDAERLPDTPSGGRCGSCGYVLPNHSLSCRGYRAPELAPAPPLKQIALELGSLTSLQSYEAWAAENIDRVNALPPAETAQAVCMMGITMTRLHAAWEREKRAAAKPKQSPSGKALVKALGAATSPARVDALVEEYGLADLSGLRGDVQKRVAEALIAARLRVTGKDPGAYVPELIGTEQPYICRPELGMKPRVEVVTLALLTGGAGMLGGLAGLADPGVGSSSFVLGARSRPFVYKNQMYIVSGWTDYARTEEGVHWIAADAHPAVPLELYAGDVLSEEQWKALPRDEEDDTTRACAVLHEGRVYAMLAARIEFRAREGE